MFNGNRAEMELFFKVAGYPTPVGWNPADHDVTAVNDEFRNNALPVAEWDLRFKQWSLKESQAHGFMHPHHESGELSTANKHWTNKQTSSMKEAASKERKETARSGSFMVAAELTHHYFLKLAFNPGECFELPVLAVMG